MRHAHGTEVFFELPDIHIRGCKPSELHAVHAIELACFGVADALPLIVMRQYHELCGAGFVVGETPAELVGFAIAGATLEDRELGWILDVSVAPSHQGRGIGQSLCANLLATAAGNGVRRIRATVAPDN